MNTVKKHQKLIDKNFEIIMENIVPFIHRQYLKDIDIHAAETCGENSEEKFQVILSSEKHIFNLIFDF